MDTKYQPDDFHVTMRTFIVSVALLAGVMMIVGNIRGYMSDKLAMENGYTRAVLPGYDVPQWVRTEPTP